MSSFAVTVEEIRDIQPHPNADRLEIATVLDWNCVVAKGSFTKGDFCAYIPIDSILPESVEKAIFGEDSKITLEKHRVKTIKLRGVISQGLVVELETIGKLVPFVLSKIIQGNPTGGWSGFDLTKALGIIKYEPPVSSMPSVMGGKVVPYSNPNFKKYTDIENGKKVPGIFQEGDLVSITEKIHGTNFRAGYVKTHANTLWKKFLRFFNVLPEYEFVYGSHNRQLQDGPPGKTWLQNNGKTTKNVYKEMVDKYCLRESIHKGYVIYGEIYGDGIQKGYTYGCAKDEHKLVVFDVMRDDKYLNVWGAMTYTYGKLSCQFVPELYHGPYYLETANALVGGPSCESLAQPVREGIVIKPYEESYHMKIGRKIVKLINPEYLLKDQTEFH